MEARCQCGKLTATIADRAEAMTVLCHCLDCQRRSGSAFGIMAYFIRAAVSLSGPVTEFTRSSDAGNSFTHGFCPQCGSTVYARASRYPELIGIAVGALADPAFPAPRRSVFEQSRHHWFTIPETIASHPRGRDSHHEP